MAARSTRASTEGGKSYSDLPNAFRYRKELVAGCTCNGKDPTGLAAIKIDDDKTLRKGDIVAGFNGLGGSPQVVSTNARHCNFPRVRPRFAPVRIGCRWWRRNRMRFHLGSKCPETNSPPNRRQALFCITVRRE